MIERAWSSYRVQAHSKRPILQAVTRALERSGGKVLVSPSPDEAPSATTKKRERWRRGWTRENGCC